MAGGGYRGIHAAVPPAQHLRLASGKRGSRSRSKSEATATATATASRASPLPQVLWLVEDLHRSRNGSVYSFLPFASNHSRPSVSSPAFDFDAPPPRAHGAGPERATGRKGQKRFGYFGPGRAGFSKVTRCKSETISGHHRSNGYVRPQKIQCLTQSLREQASLLQGNNEYADGQKPQRP